MWARIVEICLGLWLGIAPWVLVQARDPIWLTANDMICGVVIVGLALMSFSPRARQAHLGEIGVALWLIGSGRLLSGYPPSPALQNDILVGLVLLLFAVIPNQASLPPREWEPYLSSGTTTRIS